MNNLIRVDKTHKIHDLPYMKLIQVLHGEEIGYSGTIVRRRLEKAQMLWHYAIVYGMDSSGIVWLLENNDNGVELVTWKDFLSSQKHFEFTYFEKELNRQPEILKRAKERAFHPYHISKNNCEHFSNYCVNGILKSFQAEPLIEGADALLSLLEVKVLELMPDLIDEYTEARDILGVPRKNKELLSLIDSSKRKKEH